MPIKKKRGGARSYKAPAMIIGIEYCKYSMPIII